MNLFVSENTLCLIFGLKMLKKKFKKLILEYICATIEQKRTYVVKTGRELLAGVKIRYHYQMLLLGGRGGYTY